MSGDSRADHPLWMRKALTEFRLCGNPSRATLKLWRRPRCNIQHHSAHHLLSNAAITYPDRAQRDPGLMCKAWFSPEFFGYCIFSLAR